MLNFLFIAIFLSIRPFTACRIQLEFIFCTRCTTARRKKTGQDFRTALGVRKYLTVSTVCVYGLSRISFLVPALLFGPPRQKGREPRVILQVRFLSWSTRYSCTLLPVGTTITEGNTHKSKAYMHTTSNPSRFSALIARHFRAHWELTDLLNELFVMR